MAFTQQHEFSERKKSEQKLQSNLTELLILMECKTGELLGSQ